MVLRSSAAGLGHKSSSRWLAVLGLRVEAIG